MTRKTIKVFLLFSLSVATFSCYQNDAPEFHEGSVEGYKPVYATDADIDIAMESAQPIHHPGKIYTYGKWLLINEKLKGIHVINNEDPSHPMPVGFLTVLGNVDMAVYNNTLIVDHIGDIVSLDVSDWSDIKEISRTAAWQNNFPPERGYYFECVDDSKGRVAGWILTTITNAKCYR